MVSVLGWLFREDFRYVQIKAKVIPGLYLIYY